MSSTRCSRRWKGSREYLLAQLIGLVEQFFEVGPNSRFSRRLFEHDDLAAADPAHAEHDQGRAAYLGGNPIGEHRGAACRCSTPSTRSAAPATCGRGTRAGRCGTDRSHINLCVFDSTWEASEAFDLDRSEHVAAWVKNDHLGFEILYVFKGVVRKYRPDFLDSANERHDARFGGEGRGYAARPSQAAISGRVGSGSKCARWLRSLDVGRRARTEGGR